MCLVSLEDPGLTIFGTHRLLSDLDADAQERLADGIREHFEVEEVAADDLDPAGSDGTGVFGYIDAHHRRGLPPPAQGHRGDRRGARPTARRPTGASTR